MTSQSDKGDVPQRLRTEQVEVAEFASLLSFVLLSLLSLRFPSSRPRRTQRILAIQQRDQRHVCIYYYYYYYY